MADVKELKEAIAGLGEVVLLVKKIMKDGKISLDDVQHLKDAEFSEVMEGIKGIELVKDEVKDLSLDEAKEVIELLVAEFKKAQAA